MPAPVHEYEPTQAQGTAELNNNLCIEDVIVDVVEDNTNMIVLEESRIARSDETLTNTQVRETSPDDSDKLESYDPSLDMPFP